MNRIPAPCQAIRAGLDEHTQEILGFSLVDHSEFLCKSQQGAAASQTTSCFFAPPQGVRRFLNFKTQREDIPRSPVFPRFQAVALSTSQIGSQPRRDMVERVTEQAEMRQLVQALRNEPSNDGRQGEAPSRCRLWLRPRRKLSGLDSYSPQA